MGFLMYQWGKFLEKRFPEIPLAHSAVCVGFLGLLLWGVFRVQGRCFSTVLILGALVNLLYTFVLSRGLLDLILMFSHSISSFVPKPPQIPRFLWVSFGGTTGVLRRSIFVWIFLLPLVLSLGLIHAFLPKKNASAFFKYPDLTLYSLAVSFSANFITVPLFLLSPQGSFLINSPHLGLLALLSLLTILLFSVFSLIGGFVGENINKPKNGS